MEEWTSEDLMEAYRACFEGKVMSETIMGVDAEGVFIYHVRTGKIERPNAVEEQE